MQGSGSGGSAHITRLVILQSKLKMREGRGMEGAREEERNSLQQSGSLGRNVTTSESKG